MHSFTANNNANNFLIRPEVRFGYSLLNVNVTEFFGGRQLTIVKVERSWYFFPKE